MTKSLFYKISFCFLFIFACLFTISPITNKSINYLTKVLNHSINIQLWSYRITHYSLFFAVLFLSLLIFSFIKFKSFEFNNNIFFDFFFLFISSFFILFFTSTTSPFYKYHTWDDSNCFFTVGQNILNGLVPYKDLIEQKGPLLYFIHAIASLISSKSFLGVFLIQVILLTSFSILANKTLNLFTNKKVVYFIPFLTAIFFTSKNYILGDSAEEICFVLLMYPIYCSIKKLLTNNEYSFKELLIIGICAGCILWIKYTMCFFFIGWTIIPVYSYLKNSNYKGIFFAALIVLTGILITTIPFFIYFANNNALNDWFQVYFYNNIFLYGNSSSIKDILISFATNLTKWIIKNPKLLIPLLLSIYFFIKQKKLVLLLSILFPFITLSIGIFIGGNVQPYYSLILDVFLIFSLIPINNLFTSKNKCFEIFLIPILSILFSYCFAQYSYISKLKRSDFPHFVISDYINKYENPSILEYGTLANGFYTLCNSKPVTKYFCILNIPLNEMYSEQNRIISEGLVDFVITWDNELFSENYELILKKDVYLRTNNTAYLYKNINLMEQD